MDKAEILSKSQKENDGLDLYSLEISRQSMKYGWAVASCILMVVAIADAFLFNRLSIEIYFGLLSGYAAIYLYKYRKLHKKFDLFLFLFSLSMSIVSLVVWIMLIVKG